MLHAQNIKYIPQYLNGQDKFLTLRKDQSYCGTIATKYTEVCSFELLSLQISND